MSLGVFIQHATHQDFALLGELDRVADQIQQHLPQAPLIAKHRTWHSRRHEGHQLQALFVGARREHIGGTLNQCHRRKPLLAQIDLACLYFGEIENIVNDVQQ